jgi:hypothetical protein
MDNNAEIAARLTEFGISRCGSAHGWKTKFAEKLAMPPQQLHKLLTGVNAIGMITQNKLRELGCDIEWLMTGVLRDTTDPDPIIQFDMPGHLTKEQGEQYKKLLEEIRKVSSDDPEAIEKMLILTQTVFKKKK